MKINESTYERLPSHLQKLFTLLPNKQKEEVLKGFPNAPGQLADIINDPSRTKSKNVYGAMKRGEHEASHDRRYVTEGSTNFAMTPGARRNDSGSAARFFYCAKASGDERDDNPHATVKPLALMEYLCRLIKQPELNLVIDPFAGSGSTLLACEMLGIQCIGIELEEEHCEIIAKRFSKPMQTYLL